MIPAAASMPNCYKTQGQMLSYSGRGRRKLAGGQHHLAGLPEPIARVAREHGSVEDEDAEFAAELRAALREERLRSGNAACSGCEAVDNGVGLAGGVSTGAKHPQMREYPQPDSSERQEHCSAADEDADFAAEFRAALREQQLRSSILSSSGRAGVFGQVIHEGLSRANGSHRGDRVEMPPESAGPLWADQRRLLLRRRGAGAEVEYYREQSAGIHMDLHKRDNVPGVGFNAELAAEHATALRARIEELCAGSKQNSKGA